MNEVVVDPLEEDVQVLVLDVQEQVVIRYVLQLDHNRVAEPGLVFPR